MIVIPTDIQKKISEALSLPYDDSMQDWDMEVADAERVEEFITFLKKGLFTKEEKYAVMALLIASFDNLLWTERTDSTQIWEQIKELLLKDRDLYVDHINYWSLKDESDDPENLFKITSFMREFS
ncbi:MAG: hypothetical protein LUE98_18170 [Tannerellaceae bacterium]|nr:hypothetical protein [Tannerellaceae bacterium]